MHRTVRCFWLALTIYRTKLAWNSGVVHASLRLVSELKLLELTSP